MTEAAPIRTIGFREHSQRRILAGEVHARPYESLNAPVRASRIAMLHGSPEDERAHLASLLISHGAEPPGDGASYFLRDLGGFRLRWERHSEFSTYTFMRFDPFDLPVTARALDLLPADWLESLPGEMITAVHVAVTKTLPDDLGAIFDNNPLVGSKVLWGAGVAWTDFRLHADGFGRYVLHDLGLTAGQTGRLMQRLLEIETYRMMALLAFPLARHAAGEIARIDRDLAGIVTQLADPHIAQNDRDLLEHLTRLAAEAEQLDAATSFRLSAAKAYYAIVNQRIAELREDRIPGLQTIAEFIDRRLGPAMKTCESVSERQQLLATRVSRAGDLLRTRVDIALEEKNRDLLKSMNRRAELQLRLQETVEGLSVVAISYYLLGLIGYLAKGLKSVGLPVDYDLAGLIGLPVVAGAVWLGVRRLRKAIVKTGED
ncbi:DUF3422 domain-containing protein [Paramagnetospirillum kuznetsovii]|uniref:DUF3422 domain-containing protein n=1 Tax=Paramagnetospirillum kuznetsovii TaxID=2053833 RepID=A0A364P1E5_9PROT|nr:DUF3422 domain-containing protein [Paramagnetospirillum kuznetsovii]RAU23169.1 DUF3422 domain-containing protein [Paramagnetospirillum kuznetsovii]